MRAVSVTINYDLAPVGTSWTRLLVNSNDPDESPYPSGVFVNVTKQDEGSCSGEDVLIQDRVFDGTTVCVAQSTLTANTNVLVQSGADVTFNSPVVTLGNGFSVEVGAAFKVDVTLLAAQPGNQPAESGVGD
ncbi:unnamed protein product [marine sediment metagenome]|uniref:Uncharacterized protein n=1 Tax=marine sediment metagenome TaxID=412755 RepID=X0Z944_9ZZZZ